MTRLAAEALPTPTAAALTEIAHGTPASFRARNVIGAVAPVSALATIVDKQGNGSERRRQSIVRLIGQYREHSRIKIVRGGLQ